MDTQIVVVFCTCDDLLKQLSHEEDPRCKMSDAEVMTTALVAVLFFAGNFSLACRFLQEQGYIPNMLGKSRFSRRLHRMQPYFLSLFVRLAEQWKTYNLQKIYAMDSFPVAVCDNFRIPQAKLYQSERYRGYIGSKRRYFYGLKLQLLVTRRGQPVEFFLPAGSVHDAKALRNFRFNLPAGSLITADKAYNHYETEDSLATRGLYLRPFRKKNSKRGYPLWLQAFLSTSRQIVETTGSLIHRLLPSKIHATSSAGFELKVVLFVLACSLSFLF